MKKDEEKTKEELLNELRGLRKRTFAQADAGPEEILESRDLLRKVLDILPVGVWIMDRKGKIIAGNPAGLSIWAGGRYVGIEGFGEYKGWWVSTGQRIRPEEWAAARAIMKGETSIHEEIEIECFDKTRKTILNSAMPVRDDSGEIAGAVIVNQDITELKNREEQQKKRGLELKEALDRIKVLTGLLPICARCKRIRDEKGEWSRLEKYISDHSDAEFTHSICPECAEEMYRELG